MIKVIIVDDHNLVRQGLRALLEKANDIQVIGEAADGLQAVQMVQRLSPDVVVMDIYMPNLNGTQAVERIKSLKLNTRAVMLSMYKDETLIHQTMQAGAKGFLLKSSVVEELLLAVRAAARGETYLSPAISEILVSDMLHMQSSSGPGLMDRLSSREREVMQLIAEGHTNAKIGEILNLSEKTIEKHRASLIAKLDIQNLADLIRMAIKHGLISVDV